MNVAWDTLGDGTFRCRLPFLDVTVGLVVGRTGRLLIDAGTTLTEAQAIAQDVQEIAALRTPEHQIQRTVIDLGDRSVSISHPGRGHTDHDVIAVITDEEQTIVFCGDLVEQSGDPCIDTDSDVAAWPATLDRVIEAGRENAVFVPGHGAVVGIDFVRGQQAWLRERL